MVERTLGPLKDGNHSFVYYNGLGCCYAMTGRLEEAVEQARRVVMKIIRNHSENFIPKLFRFLDAP